MTDQKPFRAIIVGGGLVGLTAAHVLSKADIDFVILEKHADPASTFGTTLAFWPQTFRTFDQLGLLQLLQPLLDHMEQSFIISPQNARIRMEDETFELMEKNHGHPIRIIHRPDLAKFLYESLPESVKSRILTKKRVVGIDVFEDGVKVTCDDGTAQEGSIVIGADGVRSTVRQHLQARHFGKRPEDLSTDQKHPYVAAYRLYFSTVHPLPGLAPNTRWDATQEGLSTQIIIGTNRAWFGVYEKLDSPTSECKRYTEDDKAEVLRKWGDTYMAPGWKFRDVDAKRNSDVGLIDLEEGLVDTWFWKRIVLAGDAIRKMEPHAGLGFNCGVMDVVVLANALRQLLQYRNAPSTQELENTFSRYQADRSEETQKAADISMKAVRYLAWPTWKEKAMSMYVLPYFPLNRWTCNNSIGPFVGRTPVLEWLEERQLPASRIPWKHHPFHGEEIGSKKSVSDSPYTALLLVSTITVAIVGYIGRNYHQLLK